MGELKYNLIVVAATIKPQINDNDILHWKKRDVHRYLSFTQYMFYALEHQMTGSFESHVSVSITKDIQISRSYKVQVMQGFITILRTNNIGSITLPLK